MLKKYEQEQQHESLCVYYLIAAKLFFRLEIEVTSIRDCEYINAMLSYEHTNDRSSSFYSSEYLHNVLFNFSHGMG